MIIIMMMLTTTTTTIIIIIPITITTIATIATRVTTITTILLLLIRQQQFCSLIVWHRQSAVFGHVLCLDMFHRRFRGTDLSPSLHQEPAGSWCPARVGCRLHTAAGQLHPHPPTPVPTTHSCVGQHSCDSR